MRYSFYKKNMVAVMIMTAMTQGVFAQQAMDQKSPATTATANAPATNPFGANKPTDTGAKINYNSGSANIDGNRKVVIPDNMASSANSPNPIPNPAMAQQQAGIPMQAPVGLPQDSQQQYNQPQANRRGNDIDPIEATMNILNTPNSKIRELNKDLYQKGRVINEGPTTAAKSVNGFVVAHLSPGSTSPVVRVSKNRTTTIVMTDMTGQPWPIVNYDGLSDEDFTVKRLDNPAPDGFVLSITPKGAFVSGNLVLVLKGLQSTISIDFVPAQKEVDARSEIRVQARGPNTQLVSVGLPNSLDTNLLSILQGVSPTGAKELKMSTSAVQGWLARDGGMYLRTRYKIMSPAFENVTSSPDGTYAYKMVPVSVVLYKTDDGRFGEFAVEGF